MHFYPYFPILFYSRLEWCLECFFMHLVYLFVQIIQDFEGGTTKPKDILKEEAGEAKLSIEDDEKLKKSAFI